MKVILNLIKLCIDYFNKSKTMEIYLDRKGTGKYKTDLATIGELTVGNLKCLILEDDYDEVKEYAHTRIPAGRYKLTLRKYGGHHERYKERFPSFHKGMIQLMDVPNYKDILIHCGNVPDDTAGCLLTGTSKVHESRVRGSEIAYRKIYPTIADAIEKGDTYINITD